MKVTIIHTDFRIYWPYRLSSLQDFLFNNNIELFIIEIAGLGGPYGFDNWKSVSIKNWKILFPDKKIENIKVSTIKNKLFKTLDEINPQIVIAGALAFYSGALATQWSVKHNKKLIIFDDARLENVQRNFITNIVKIIIYKNVDAIFCPSEEWESTFNFFGFSKNQIYYGINIVNNDFWAAKEEHADKLNNLTNFFLSVGRLIPKKNYPFLLKAYKSYSNLVKNPSSLVIIGDGSAKKDLIEIARNENINNVYFLPFLSQEDLRKYYHKAKAFILPSYYAETWGLVINEAMAVGLPIISSNKVGCVTTLIKEGVNGYTFSPSNVDDLSNILVKFHNLSIDDQNKMGEASKEIISEWNIDKFNNGLFQSIQFVLNYENSKRTLIPKLVSKFWSGRYRPV